MAFRLAFLGLLLLPLVSFAGAPPLYEVVKIPAPLLEKANAVVRAHNTTFTVKSPSSAVKNVKYAVTILNEKAKHEATLVVHYDKSIKVNYLRGSLYNSLGQQVKSLKKTDIH